MPNLSVSPGSFGAWEFWGGFTGQSSGLTGTPGVVFEGQTVTLNLIGGGTEWDIGSPGAPAFEVSAGRIISQTVISGFMATLTLLAPHEAGTVTITDPSTGAVVSIDIHAGISTGSLVYAGDDAGLMFPFLVDGEFVVPDAASFTVRDNTGGSLLTANLSLTDASTQVFISVPGDLNTVADGKDFEGRSVEIQFTYGGRGYRARQNYRVSLWVNMSCGEADVRSALGVLDHELADREIHLQRAYLKVKDRVGLAAVSAALVAGDLTTEYVNLAIVMAAAIDVIPSLQLRAAISVQDDNQTFERFSKIDFVALREDLAEAYEDALFSLIPLVDRVPSTGLTMLVTSLPTDAITGV